MKKISLFFKENNYLKFTKILKNFFFINRTAGPDILKINLIEGLKKNLLNFNINPNINNYFYHCIVLDDVNKLKQLIKIKKSKKINIIAGPNLMIMPDEYNKILYNKEIDKILVPSLWVKKKYIEVSKNKLKNKIHIWASGIDHKYWKPKKNKAKKKYVLIYSKFIRNEKILMQCLYFLKKEKINYKLIEYGNYKNKEYLSALQSSNMVIFFSESESQGLAYFEAWSANVPTLIYNPENIYRFPYKTKTSSCPYLNKNLGEKFKNLKSFKIKFRKLQKKKSLNPRKEVLHKYTINKSVKNLLKIIK